MFEVTPHLYIGSYAAATNVAQLRAHQITHIVNMAYECENKYPEQINYLHIPAKDVLSQRLSPYFQNIASFVRDAQHADGKTLIHCQEGISRSATAVLACLMLKEAMRLGEAVQLLRSAKPDIEPNPAFVRELRVLERALYGDYYREKITMLDTCEPPHVLDWRESLSILLSRAATSSIVFDISAREAQCLLDAFRCAGDTGSIEFQSLVCAVISRALESFGGRTDPDRRARALLEDVLIRILPSEGICTASQIYGVLRRVSASEDFRDLVIDVPEARSWLNGCLARDVQ